MHHQDENNLGVIVLSNTPLSTSNDTHITTAIVAAAPITSANTAPALPAEASPTTKTDHDTTNNNTKTSSPTKREQRHQQKINNRNSSSSRRSALLQKSLPKIIEFSSEQITHPLSTNHPDHPLSASMTGHTTVFSPPPNVSFVLNDCDDGRDHDVAMGDEKHHSIESHHHGNPSRRISALEPEEERAFNLSPLTSASAFVTSTPHKMNSNNNNNSNSNSNNQMLQTPNLNIPSNLNIRSINNNSSDLNTPQPLYQQEHQSQLLQQQQLQIQLDSPFAPSPNSKKKNSRIIPRQSSLHNFVKDRRKDDEIIAMLNSVEGSHNNNNNRNNHDRELMDDSSYRSGYYSLPIIMGSSRSRNNTRDYDSGDDHHQVVVVPLSQSDDEDGNNNNNNNNNNNSNNYYNGNNDSNNNNSSSSSNCNNNNNTETTTPIPKEFTIRQFPNGDLFSGNVHSHTKDLIYGRMTYALDMEVYEGPFWKGKRHGEGAVCMKMDGAGKFLGRYHEGQMHSGTLIVSRGNSSDFTYTGSFQNNDFHGEGTIATSNGTVYQGQFAYGEFHGMGTLQDASDDSVYTGDFVEGLFHGSGTMVYPDGANYAGTWYEGRRVEGTETLSNGDVFEGKFRDNVREGQGILKTKHSRITKKGVWNKDVLVEGVDLSITFADGHCYLGDHVHSRPHGFGKMEYADYGSGTVTYTGQFMNGFRHGEGHSAFHKSGEEYEGEWICDEPSELKLFQHNGPLCEEEGEVDLKDEVYYLSVPPSKNGPSNTTAGGYTTELSSSKTTVSTQSLVSTDTMDSSTVTSGGMDKSSRSNNNSQQAGNMQHRRRRRRRSSCQERKVDFDPDSCMISSNMNSSMVSLNVLDFTSDTPKLYRYKNGDIFKGRLDAKKLRQGSGVYTEHRMGSVYDGDWKDSMRHGVGLLTLASGVDYSGEFFKDHVHGQGTLTLIDASIYTGGFFNGLFHGHGTFEDVSNNRTYIGEFENGLRHGEGQEKYSDGTLYKGEFKNGKRHGMGVLHNVDGSDLYRGEWQHDFMHGKGLRLHHKVQSNWEGNYDGDFSRGKFCGNGTFTYTDGTCIEGQWLDDIPRDGDWTINYPDGSKFYGFATFRNPEEEHLVSFDDSSSRGSATSSPAHLRVPLPHGFGTLTYPSGQRYIGSFTYGDCKETRRSSTMTR